MTEPVAYLAKSRKSGAVNATVKEWSYHDFENIPLYTKEQLQPKVQMTQAEFDEFHDLFENDFDLYSAITEISDTNLRTTLYDRLFTGTQKDKDKQNEFAVLWASYNPLEPEETIEIVPNMKWFVVSKEANKRSGDYNAIFSLDISDTNGIYRELSYDQIGRYAYQFDTKEEAEKWTNPLTEAVQLPVEGE